jgi:hypothetical protein
LTNVDGTVNGRGNLSGFDSMAHYGATEDNNSAARRRLDTPLRVAVCFCAVAAVLCVLLLSRGSEQQEQRNSLLSPYRWARGAGGSTILDDIKPARKINYKFDADNQWQKYGDYKETSALKHLLFEEKKQRETLAKLNLPKQ